MSSTTDSPSSPKLEAASKTEKVGLSPSELGREGEVVSLRSGEDVLALQDVDPVLNMKMHLVNNVSCVCVSV